MGLDLLIPRRGAHKPEESLAGFVRRRLGNEALARIAQPMVGGIYTADPEHLSLRHTFPLFEEMEAKHRSLLVGMRARMKAQAANNEQASGPRYGLFLSLPEGWQQLIDTLSTRLTDLGTTLRSNSPVSNLNTNGSTWKATLADDQTANGTMLLLPAQPM